MPTVARYGKPYVWVTWTTALLAGTESCKWASWFKAHFKFDKVEREGSLAAWQANHTSMLNARAEELRADGYTVTLEEQNKFTWTGQTAQLGGKVDIVAMKTLTTGVIDVLIVDCKSGKKKDSDWFQVMAYLIALPKLWALDARLADAATRGRWRGEVCYKDHKVTIQPEEITADRRQQLFDLMKELGGDTRPPKVPSARECRYCDIPKSDCPERMAEPANTEAMTTDF